MDTKEIILKTLKDSGKPLKSGEIADITNIDKKQVAGIIKQLKTDGSIISPKRGYYQIKK